MAIMGIKSIVKAQKEELSLKEEIVEKVADKLIENGFNFVEDGEMIFGGQASEAVDLFGTQTGTTTAATSGSYDPTMNSDFSDMASNNAGYNSTTKAIMLDGRTDTALITIKPLTASTTNFFAWTIDGSNDRGCDTAATSTSDARYVPTLPIKNEVNWFSVDPTNSRATGGKGNVKVGTSATSTETILLTNLNWRCLRLSLDSSSTTLWAQIKQKINY